MSDETPLSDAAHLLPIREEQAFGAEPQPDGNAARQTLGGIYVGPPVIRAALLNSFWDGIMANGMIALCDTFTIAAAIALGASSMGIALLSSLPLLIGSIAQFLLPAWADPKMGRKHYVLWGVRGQALFLFLAGLSGWLPVRWAPLAYIALFVASAVSNNTTGPYWVAWMGDLMPGAARGRHFAWRSVFFSWMYLSCSLGAGLISRRYGAQNAPWLLFACVFMLAALLRSVSHVFMTRQYEPVSSLALEAFSPLGFRPGKDFLIYCLATGLFQGAAAMSGPFFNVWYLRDLHFSYLILSITLSLPVIGAISVAGFWGKLADHLGSGRVLWISGLLVALIPILFSLTQNRWLILTICFYNGIAWGGYNLANFNHLLNATDSRHRSHYIAFASLVVGLIGCAFSLLGGFLATRLPVLPYTHGWPLQTLFLLSGVLRLTFFAVFFGRFRQYRGAGNKAAAEFYMELPGFRIGAGLIRIVSRGFRAP